MRATAMSADLIDQFTVRTLVDGSSTETGMARAIQARAASDEEVRAVSRYSATNLRFKCVVLPRARILPFTKIARRVQSASDSSME